MKQLALLLITILISVIASLGQSQYKTSITTDDEYNYMTKGYQIQITSGLDMKKGYATGTVITIKEGNYSFDFIPFLKVGKDTSLVGYIVKAVSHSWNNTYWYGLPLGNQQLLNKCFESISNLDRLMTAAFFKSYMRLQTHIY